jgi:hypothetical protein
VAPSSESVRLVWSNDSTELFYTTPLDVKSVRLADGAIRTLAAGEGFADLDLAPGGAALYAVGAPSSGGLHGLVDLLTGRRFPDLPLDYGIPHNVWPVAVSPNGKYLALEVNGGVGLYELATGSVTAVPGCAPALNFDPRPAVFSPTGAEILCTAKDGGPWGALIVDLSSGVGRMVTIGGLVHWGSEGLRSLEGGRAAGTVVFSVKDVEVGTTRVIHAVDPSFLAGGAEWSADGRVIAMWERARCDDAPSMVCYPFRSRLLVIDLDSGTAAVLASGADSPGAIAFSSDSMRVAYVIGTTIHVRAVR